MARQLKMLKDIMNHADETFYQFSKKYRNYFSFELELLNLATGTLTDNETIHQRRLSRKQLCANEIASLTKWNGGVKDLREH